MTPGVSRGIPLRCCRGGWRVFLLRHGRPRSLSGRHTGAPTCRSPSAGGAGDAAGELGRALRGDRPPALVLSSPRSRARDTAELAGLRVDRVDERLAEWDYGSYEGRTTAEIRVETPGWTVWTHPCPGGETAAQVGARADAVLAEARAAQSGGDVVLVGHGHFSRVLIARWIGLRRSAGRVDRLLGGAGRERGAALDQITCTPPEPCMAFGRPFGLPCVQRAVASGRLLAAECPASDRRTVTRPVRDRPALSDRPESTGRSSLRPGSSLLPGRAAGIY